MSQARVKLAERSQGSRCAVCHDALGRSRHVCLTCGTTLHEECRRALPNCPTLGCVGAPPSRRSWIREDSWALATLLTTGAIGLATPFVLLHIDVDLGLAAERAWPALLAYLVLHFLVLPTAWATRRARRDSPWTPSRIAVATLVVCFEPVIAVLGVGVFMFVVVLLARVASDSVAFAAAMVAGALAFPAVPSLAAVLAAGSLRNGDRPT